MKNKKRWYRRFVLDVDRETVRDAVANYTGDPDKYTHSRFQGPYCPPDTAALDGKTLVFRGEGLVLRFALDGAHRLRFAENGGEETTCWCNVKSMDDEVFLVNFLVPGNPEGRQITLIADMVSGSATVCDAHFGTANSNIDVGREFFFGRLDGDFAGGPLHGFTNDMVGMAVIWDYGTLVVKHMYVSNLYYSYSNPPGEDNGAWMATNPADYIKIRDKLFLFSFVEERQHGLQSIFLMDMEKYHDIGCFFGVSADHVTSACVGARGTPAQITTVF